MQVQEAFTPAIENPVNTPVRQLSVFLHNRVGTLMALVKLLNDNKIEVLGISMQETTELNLARLILSDPESAETLFMERGIPHTDCRVIVTEIHEGGDHTLSACLSALLTAEINIEFSYPLMCRPGNWPLLVLRVDDLEVGSDALLKAGFKLLGQGDISR